MMERNRKGKKVKNLKGNKSMKRTFSLWSFLLFLSKETDSDSTKPGGNKYGKHSFWGRLCLPWQSPFY